MCHRLDRCAALDDGAPRIEPGQHPFSVDPIVDFLADPTSMQRAAAPQLGQVLICRYENGDERAFVKSFYQPKLLRG